MDQVTIGLLTNWDLQEYVQAFYGIWFGDRARFKANLENWKLVISSLNSRPEPQQTSLAHSECDEPPVFILLEGNSLNTSLNRSLQETEVAEYTIQSVSPSAANELLTSTPKPVQSLTFANQQSVLNI